MDNTQKKKKKINIPLVLIAIGFVSFIGYFGYEYFYKPLNMLEEGNAGNEILQKVEDGTVYIYSEEEKQAFREAAAKFREEKVAQKDLRPGDALYHMKIEELEKSFEDLPPEVPRPIDLQNTDNEEDALMLFYHGKLSDIYHFSKEKCDEKEKYFEANSVKPGNLFDENLKLKKPEAFYGFTSVAKPIFDTTGLHVGDNNFGHLEHRPEFAERNFRVYAKTLKNIDKNYKDSKELNSLLNSIIAERGEEVAWWGNNLEDAKIGAYGGKLITNLEFFENQKNNSINPFQNLIRFAPGGLTIPGDDLSFTFNEDKEETDIELFPQTYNYFTDESKENYYVDYIPTKVTKYDENTFLVDIEVDKPIDRTGIFIIINNFRHHFYNGSPMTVKIPDSETTDLTIRITHKDLTSGMLDEYGLYIVTPAAHATNDRGRVMDRSASIFGNHLNWYPNEEAQVWVKEYFELAKEAFDNDSRFSMFETMHQLADKYGVSHKAMESVICSYYFAFTYRF